MTTLSEIAKKRPNLPVIFNEGREPQKRAKIEKHVFLANGRELGSPIAAMSFSHFSAYKQAKSD